MGDLFKAFSSGIAQFVYAWVLPSAIACGIFTAVILPTLRNAGIDIGLILSGALFLLATLTLSVTFAYAARPIYRFLEGYSMPKWLARWRTIAPSSSNDPSSSNANTRSRAPRLSRRAWRAAAASCCLSISA